MREKCRVPLVVQGLLSLLLFLSPLACTSQEQTQEQGTTQQQQQEQKAQEGTKSP
ncbi:MAG: hypothetical protein NZ578_09945 [Candidatus Binatia bacterium]|nr:hypothetical protein [Candidatus Binatia bacterium]